ncbi:MAG: Holliday junction resolvase RuvX [Lachnospiraceae bacterium]|nr:Holliday junction resolvase RuvX [Lachnospiraceae bacterium]
MKYIGLDYGAKSVGIALTDETGTLARGVETVFRDSEKRLRKTLRRIEEIIVESGAGALVVGLPLNMDGSEGERAEKARDFGQALARRTGLPVYYQDERLSTVEAGEILELNGVNGRRERKERIDNVAAAVILEDYLNTL